MVFKEGREDQDIKILLDQKRSESLLAREQEYRAAGLEEKEAGELINLEKAIENGAHPGEDEVKRMAALRLKLQDAKERKKE